MVPELCFSTLNNFQFNQHSKRVNNQGTSWEYCDVDINNKELSDIERKTVHFSNSVDLLTFP